MKDQYHQSTLLNEKGNIPIYRVSEETRKKVAEESRLIESKRAQHNIFSRKKIRQDESEKYREREKFRNAMTEKWQQKSAASPYGIDRWKEEERRQNIIAEREMNRKINEEKIKAVASMTGRAQNVFGKAAMNHVINSQTKLALSFKQSLLDEEVIAKEQKVLDQMVLDQLSLLVDRFPSVVTDDLASSIKGTSASYQEDNDSRSKESKSDQSRSTIASSNPYAKQLQQQQQQARSDSKVMRGEGSVSTGFSGPLEYTSPDERMQDLADDLSERFKV